MILTNIVICGSSGAMGKVINNIISTRDDSKVVAGIDKYEKVQRIFQWWQLQTYSLLFPLNRM